MKKIILKLSFLILFVWGLSGCAAVGSKTTSHSIIYFTAAVLSLVLLVGCCVLVRKKRIWFVLLFSSVLVVNIGYTFLSLSTGLEAALWANRIAYLGSVFLPLAMLMIILNASGTPYPKWLHGALGALSVGIFLIAASPGILPIYYKEVSFAVVNGVATLVKVYGPLHLIYLFYLLGYFIAMLTVIIRASVRHTIHTVAHAVVLLIAVGVNIGVWFIEQLSSFEFEMLSISYIISELFLLGVHLVMNENQRLRTIVQQVEAVQTYPESPQQADVLLDHPVESQTVLPEQMEVFVKGFTQLTPTEKTIFDAYIARATTKEVMANLNIKESTLKYHNRNLYGKLGVSSRKELLEVHKHIRSVQTRLQEQDTPQE